MHIDGQCHCGHVRYEAEIDPDKISICHCTDCQTLTGSAFRVTALLAKNTIRLTGNEPKIYRKTAENGRIRLQYFCPECGTPLFTNGEGDDAESWGIRIGTIRQRRELFPKRQVWRRSALDWVDDIGSLPSADKD